MTLDYYEGAYGPTLRFYAREPALLHSLREVFLALAEGKAHEFHLNDMQFVRPLSSVGALVLRIASNEEISGEYLRIESRPSQGVSVFWSGPTEYWQRCVGLIEGMINFAPKPCHQYFNEEVADDALIELDFLEGYDTSDWE